MILLEMFKKTNQPKVSGQGTQQSVGAVTETIAAAALIHHHIDKKHFNRPENKETVESARKTYLGAAGGCAAGVQAGTRGQLPGIDFSDDLLVATGGCAAGGAADLPVATDLLIATGGCAAGLGAAAASAGDADAGAAGVTDLDVTPGLTAGFPDLFAIDNPRGRFKGIELGRLILTSLPVTLVVSLRKEPNLSANED